MEVKETVKKQYEILKKKYDFPNLEELDREVGMLDSCEEKGIVPEYLLRYIRGNMMELFSNWLGYLHNMIMPNQQSFIHMKEYEFFDESDREKVMLLINRVMHLNRASLSIEIERNDEKDAQFIKEAFKEFKDIKKEIMYFTQKASEKWKETY